MQDGVSCRGGLVIDLASAGGHTFSKLVHEILEKCNISILNGQEELLSDLLINEIQDFGRVIHLWSIFARSFCLRCWTDSYRLLNLRFWRITLRGWLSWQNNSICCKMERREARHILIQKLIALIRLLTWAIIFLGLKCRPYLIFISFCLAPTRALLLVLLLLCLNSPLLC